jgi:hypothetical protein
LLYLYQPAIYPALGGGFHFFGRFTEDNISLKSSVVAISRFDVEKRKRPRILPFWLLSRLAWNRGLCCC